MCFQKFQGVSCVSQIWRELWCSKLENMENTLKINVFEKSILFCKYLHNGSSDPYEILYGGQLISCELKYKISWRSVHKCAHTSCKRARARFIASARAYESCARICSRIFMKFKILVRKIVMDHHLKFHKDSSFRSGDICKAILTFQKH